MIIVYEVLSPSKKRYFGITSESLESRKERHTRNANNNSSLPFHNAIRKYQEKLTWRIHSQVATWKEACELEQLLIAAFNTCIYMPNSMGYNATFGGEGAFGFKFSDQVKLKLSKSHIGKKLKPITQEHKQKIIAAIIGNKWNVGKTLTHTHKNNISNSLKGREFTKQHKNNLSLSSKDKKKSSYHIQKLSDKWYIINPEGIEFYIINLNSFCKENNLSISHMCNVSKGKRKQHKGFKCYKII